MIAWLLALPAASDGPPATEGAGQTGGSNQFIFVMVAVLVLFMLLPMLGQKKEKRRRARAADIKKHDRVVTTGGIFGTVVNLDETTVTLEVSKDVRFKMKRSAIHDLEDGEKTEAEQAAAKGKKPIAAKAKS